MNYPYYYAWKNNPDMNLYPCPKRLSLFKRRCKVLKRGGMNSCLVEFENGQREIVSRNAIRKCQKEI